MSDRPDAERLVSIARASGLDHVAIACCRVARHENKWDWLKFILSVYPAANSGLPDDMLDQELRVWWRRFNQSGEFNVPFGTYKNINYVSDFHQYQSLFAGWKFTNFDLSALAIQKDDFIYADPPYDVEFTTYSSGGFSWEDQKRTAELLAAHSGPVVLSNQATPRIVELYEKLGFTLSYLDAPRRISCTGDRTAAKEVLAVRGV